jgi:nitrite reductase/ring-hydroxylating ferredoxin subunit
MAMAENWITVTEKSRLGEGEMTDVTVGDRQIAIYNVDGELYATDNVCTHAFALLSDGWLDGDVIECPLHGGRFEVKTGKALGYPVEIDLKTYPIRILGDDVQINVGD